MWKSARNGGAKHMWKSKCTKHYTPGPRLQVEISKKCTQLWHEARFEVKMLKTLNVQPTFGSSDVEKVHAFEVKWLKKATRLAHFWKFRCPKSARL